MRCPLGVRSVLTVVVALSSLACLPAQLINRVTPEAAAPGDLVILTGAGLAGTTSVEFTAFVGGFVGVWTSTAAPVSSSATRLTVVVPSIVAGWIPPGQAQGGSYVGTVKAISPLSPVAPNTASFFFLQGLPTVTTAGTGTTQTASLGKPVIGFTIAGGPPVVGNSVHTLTLENAIPGSIAQLVIGFPDTPPHLMVGDGTIVIDPAQTFVILEPPFTADSQGDVLVPLPMPSTPVNATFMAQWVLTGGAPGLIAVTNGLQVTL